MTSRGSNWQSWTRRALIGGGVALAGAGAIGLGVLMSRDGAGIVPGKSRARKVVSETDLPGKVDVVVIGGGNIGCMTALTLAERGVRVALCEKGVIAGEASGRSMGFIDGSFSDPIKLPLIARSKALWDGMNARVGGETGYRRNGMAVLFGSEESIGFAEGWLNMAKGMPSVDGQILSAKQAAEMAVGSADRYAGAYFEPSDAQAESQLFSPAVADAIRRAGGFVYQNCAVRGIETSAGRVTAVVTEKGIIPCTSVVVAGGAWSPVFARSLGLDLPQFMAFSTNARLKAPSTPGPSACIVDGERGIIMRRTIDGAYDTSIAVGTAPLTPSIIGNLPRLWPAWQNLGSQIRPAIDVSTFMSQWRIPRRWKLDQRSPFEDNRILQPEIRQSIIDDAVAGTAAAFPEIGRQPIIEKWTGALTSTLDNMPVISAVAEQPGLYIGSGFYFGLTMAPAAGEALADLVMGKTPQFDLTPYRFGRFNDGSKLVFRS